MPTVKVKLADERCRPKKAHDTDSGFDLVAHMDETLKLFCGKMRKIRTGVHLELPAGYEAQVRPRSGLSAKGLLVHFGTIDNGYRGEVLVTVTNVGVRPIVIRPYERIAQLVIEPVVQAKMVAVDELCTDTKRGDKGFGSTGRV